MNNDIKSWQQGRFIHQRQYEKMSAEWKAAAERGEAHLVRPGPTENAICQTFNPDHAKWIADRLNLASTLEQMTYDFATGKTDGQEIRDLVMANVNA